ncbi:MAG: hypothetical protein QOJ54_444 [Aliidongia sp.]|nr:hypothetical protein [Aliidongia sp.]
MFPLNDGVDSMSQQPHDQTTAHEPHVLLIGPIETGRAAALRLNNYPVVTIWENSWLPARLRHILSLTISPTTILMADDAIRLRAAENEIASSPDSFRQLKTRMVLVTSLAPSLSPDELRRAGIQIIHLAASEPLHDAALCAAAGEHFAS